MWKWLIGIVLLLVVVFGGIGAYVAFAPGMEDFRNQLSGKTPEGGGEPVRIELVERGDLTRTVSAPGSLEPKTLVKISAQVSARIVALPFEEGEYVQEGDVVVRLDARDLVAALESAEASLKSEEARLDGTEADLIRARAEYNRIIELYDTKDVSKSEMEEAEALFLKAKSAKAMAEQSIEIAKANIEQRKKDLDNAVITSPISGTITQLHAKVGELVVIGTLNNAASVILEIADLQNMILKAAIDEANIAPVRAGQKAIVYVNAYPDDEFTGTVERIELQRSVSSDGTGFFETEILMDELEEDDSSLRRLGLTANTDVEVERLKDVLKVPTQAVVDRRVDELPSEVVGGNQNVDTNRTFSTVVYRFIDGKAKATPVRVGPSDLTHTVVLGGLENGEPIVTGPYKMLVTLKHDQAIRDMDAESEQDGESGEGEPALVEEESGEGSATKADANGGSSTG